MKRRVAALALVFSGFTALVYEIIWTRLLGFAFGIILMIVFGMARNAGRKHDFDENLEEENDAGTPPTKAADPPAEKRDDWEREADWWKKR